MPRTEEYREDAPPAPPPGLPATYPGLPASHPSDPVEGGAPAVPAAVAALPARSAWEQAHAEMFRDTESHPAPWRPGPAPRPAPAGPPPSGKLVVLSGGLGPWRQGEVIEAAWLEAFPGCDLRRLYDAGAVRAADEREAAQERVTLPGTPAATPLELQVLDRDRRIEQQAQDIVALRDQLRAAKQSPPPAAGPGPQGVDPRLIAEKDKVIMDLRGQLAEARGRQEQPPAPEQAQPAAEPPEPPPPAEPEEGKGLFGRKKK